MKFDDFPGACSLAAHIALREPGLPFKAVRVDLAKHQLDDRAHDHNFSPRGHVPVLAFDNGSRHSEAAAGAHDVANADAFSIVNWANALSIPVTAFPNGKTFLARVSSRPAVQTALRAEGLVQ